MRKGKYSDEQLIAILREQEAGRPTAEICRKYGVSNATFYKWKSKYGGMQVSDAKRLKALEEVNRRPKKRLAEEVMDNATLKEMLTKTSDAQSKENGRELGDQRQRLLSTRCLSPDRASAESLPVPHAPE